MSTLAQNNASVPRFLFFDTCMPPPAAPPHAKYIFPIAMSLVPKSRDANSCVSRPAHPNIHTL